MDGWRIIPSANGEDFMATNDEGETLEIIHSPTLDSSPDALGGQKKGYIIQDNVKHAPIQRLSEGIYPEHFVYLKSAGICGQADRVEVIQDTVDVVDYKTNKRIDKESYKDWQGISKKMLGPLAHLDDCNYNHYSLQLSLYLFIILKHNPRYKPGRLILQHVIFEKESENKYIKERADLVYYPKE